MQIAITLLAVSLALGLLWCLGMHAGRISARRVFASGRGSFRGITPIAAYEAELRRAVGARRKHPDPENAARLRRARYHR